MRWREWGRVQLRYLVLATAALAAGIAGHEGLSLPAYKDIAGVWTNGYGNTKNVVPGSVITKEQAQADLLKNIETHQSEMDKYLTRPATRGQSDAYTSLGFNIGAHAFGASTVVKDHNAGRFMDACLRILRFDKARVKGQLVSVRGLALRRYAEYNTCIAGVPSVGYVPRR